MAKGVREEVFVASDLKRLMESDLARPELDEELSRFRALMRGLPFFDQLQELSKMRETGTFQSEFPGLAQELLSHRDGVRDRLLKVTGALSKANETDVHPDLVLRPKQIRFMERLKSYFSELPQDRIPRRSGFVKYPTGLGKTIMISLILRTLAQHHEDANVLVLSPREQINIQNEEKIRKYQNPDVTVKNIADIKPGETVDATIATIQMAGSDLNKRPDKRNLKPDYNVIVLDECHRAFGEKMITLLRQRYPDAIIIGLSATPYIGTTRDAKTLKSAFHYFEGEIDSITLMEACMESDLTPIRANRVLLKNEDLAKCRTEQQLSAGINLGARIQAAVKIAKDKIAADEKGIVFCDGVEHSKDVAKAMRKEGIKAVHLDGSSTDAEKEKALKDLKSGEVQFVCNSDLLIEGFDEDTLKHAIILRPTFSPWMYEQMIGRVCRLNSLDPSKVATIWDVVGQHSGQCTIHGLSRLYGNIKESYKNGEIIFGPKERLGEREPREGTRDGTEDENLDEHGDISIDEVVVLEDIAPAKIPRDELYYNNPDWVRRDLEAVLSAFRLEKIEDLTIRLLLKLPYKIKCFNGDEISAFDYFSDASSIKSKMSGGHVSALTTLRELKETAGYEVNESWESQEAPFFSKEKIREALTEFAVAQGLADPTLLGQTRDTAPLTIFGMRLSFIDFLNAAKIVYGFDTKREAFAKLKDIADFQLEESPFRSKEKIGQALEAFATHFGVKDVRDLRPFSAASSQQDLYKKIDFCGVKMTFNDLLEQAKNAYDLRTKAHALARLKQLAGYVSPTSAVDPDYARNKGLVRDDLELFLEASGREHAYEVPLATRATISTGEELTFEKFCRLVTRAIEKTDVYASDAEKRRALLLYVGLPTAYSFIQQPSKSGDVFDGSNHVQRQKSDPFVTDAELMLPSPMTYYRNDEKVKVDLALMAKALGVAVEELSAVKKLPECEFKWGNGMESSATRYLRELGVARGIVPEGVAALRLLAEQLFPQTQTEETTTELEMDEFYFDDHAKADLAAFASKLGLGSPRNININNPSHLQAEIRCKSGKTLKLNDYIILFGSVQGKPIKILRSAWDILISL